MKNSIFSFLLILFSFQLASQNDATLEAKKYFSIGSSYYDKHEYNKAIENFSKALEFRSKITDSYFLCNIYINRATIRFILSNKEALADANQAVTLKPEYSKTYYIRALIQSNLMYEFDKALSDIDSALVFIPNDPDYLSFKAGLFIKKRQPEKALEMINKVLALEPKNTEALKTRGAIYNKLHRYDEAIQDFAKNLEYNPDDFGSLCDMASALCDIKQFDKALIQYQKALKSDSSQAFIIYSNIGYFINFEQKDYKTAIENFDKSIKQNPNFAFSYNNRAYAKYMLGDLKEAMKDINKSLSIFPKNSYAYKNKALVLIAQNKNSAACKELQKAIELHYTEDYDDDVIDLMKKHCK